MVVAGFECTHAGARNFRHLLVRKVLKIPHIEHNALFIRKFQECFLELSLNFIACHMRRRVEFRIQFAFHVTNRQKEPPFLLVEEGKALVGGDPVDPREKLGVFPEGVDVPVDLDEYFLGEVIRIVMVDYHFTDVPINPLLIRTHEHVEAVIPGIRIFNLR